jgi:hypothetical protein
MQAGARHPVSRRRHLSTFTGALVALACWAMLPSDAHAASPSGPELQALAAAQTTVAEAAAPATAAAQQAVRSVQPGQGSGLRRPGGQGGSHPVQQTVAPIAHAAAASVPPQATAVVPRKHLDERPTHRSSHLTATSSSRRLSSGRAVHGHDLSVAPRRASSERSAPAHRAAPEPIADDARQPDTAATSVAGLDRAPASSAPGAAAAGCAGGVSGGGAFALLVATLLLAGPFLRRQLSLLPVVCRPAAFHVVLERPG